MSIIKHLQEIEFESEDQISQERVEQITAYLERNAYDLATLIYNERGVEISYYQSSRIVDGENLHNGVLIVE